MPDRLLVPLANRKTKVLRTQALGWTINDKILSVVHMFKLKTGNAALLENNKVFQEMVLHACALTMQPVKVQHMYTC